MMIKFDYIDSYLIGKGALGPNIHLELDGEFQRECQGNMTNAIDERHNAKTSIAEELAQSDVDADVNVDVSAKTNASWKK